MMLREKNSTQTEGTLWINKDDQHILANDCH